MTDAIAIDVPTAADWPAFFAVLSDAFYEDVEEAVEEAERNITELDRCLVARRDGDVVGTAGVLTRRLSVPGAVVPAAHVTFVAVAPTARRQGVLTRLMHRQFADIRAAGEPVAVLWASEGRIYQRFGYGSAARRLSLTVDTREVRLITGERSGRLREGKPAELRDWMTKVYAEAWPQRPGYSERAERHWDYRLADPPAWRRGGSTLRAVAHEGADGVDGYALFRVAHSWNDGGPASEVQVVEQVATTAAGYTALWRFFITLDLVRTASVRLASLDEPVQVMVNEPRRLGANVGDGLWVRLIDVPAALSARRYATNVDVVLEVTDELIGANAGRWRLVGSPTSASCTATTDPADISLDVRVLGAIYLGGTPLSMFASAGEVKEHSAGAVAAASTAFGWHRAPAGIEVF